MRTKIILFILGLFCQMTFGQGNGEKLLHGKIMVDSGTVGGVSVINLVNEKSTVSDSNGDFYILAKAEDLLVLSSIDLEYYRRIIEDEDFKPVILVIKMVSKITVLEEVIINKYPEINAVALGISPKGIVQRTPAERKLFEANSTPVGALINLLSGRTAMLEKELEVEKKETLLVELDALFEKSYYVKSLKIPIDYIKGFHYYCIQDEKFVAVLNSKNKTNIEFCMVALSKKYLEIIASEN